MVDWLADHWDRPDEGIWETRGGRKDFTYSRLMCWVAFDAGLRLARDLSRPANTERWTAARDAILEQVMTRGWSHKAQALVQHYGGEDVLDASLLLMPRVRFSGAPEPGLAVHAGCDGRRNWSPTAWSTATTPPPRPTGCAAPRARSACAPSSTSTPLPEPTGPARRATPSRRCTRTPTTSASSPRRSEPAGEQLGNFPQAFTHLSLITAATTLDRALDREQRR